MRNGRDVSPAREQVVTLAVIAMLLLGTGCESVQRGVEPSTAAGESPPAGSDDTESIPKPPKRPVEAVAVQSLIGKTQSETRELVGRPSAVREKEPGIIWDYVRGGCTVSLMFYMDIESKSYRVLTYEMLHDESGGTACEEGSVEPS